MSLRDDLLAKVDSYCTAHHLTRAAVGVLLMKDNKFFADVAAGKRGFTIRTYERLMEALNEPPPESRSPSPGEVAA